VVQNDTTRPTKFVMICTIRSETERFDDIWNTLEFAQGIKST